MFGVSELLFLAGWRLLPSDWRLRVSAIVLELQTQSETPLPRSRAAVYAWNNSLRKRFSGSKAPELEEESCPPYSLITTCRNEAATIDEFLSSIARLTVLPSQIVICDGGSTDGTVERVKRWAAAEASKLDVELIEASEINISEGRNRAVAAATHEVLAFTDAGVTLDKLWAERILAPFIDDSETEVSMGWYKPVARSGLQHAFVRFMLPRLDAVDPETFFPSGRSLAMRREVFERSGGYPTHLTKAGEDSLFDYYLKTVAKRFAFVPEAVAFWQVPNGIRSMAKTIFYYAKGDAESGRVFGSYYLTLLPSMIKLVLELALLVLLSESFQINTSQLLHTLWLVVFVSFLIRTILFVKSYQPVSDCWGKWRVCAERVFLVLLMGACQAAGFLAGLKTRKAVSARLSKEAERGDVVLLYPEAVLGGEDSSIERDVRSYLKQGYYVTVVFSRFRDGMTEYDHPLAHSRLEQHLRGQFNIEHWRAVHHRRIVSDNHNIEFRDECNDAFSRELAQSFTETQQP